MNPESFIPALTICLMCTLGVIYFGLYRWALLCLAITSVFVGLVSGYWYLFGFLALVLLALHTGSAALQGFVLLCKLPPFAWQESPDLLPNAALWALLIGELSGIIWLIANLPK